MLEEPLKSHHRLSEDKWSLLEIPLKSHHQLSEDKWALLLILSSVTFQGYGDLLHYFNVYC